MRADPSSSGLGVSQVDATITGFASAADISAPAPQFLVGRVFAAQLVDAIPGVLPPGITLGAPVLAAGRSAVKSGDSATIAIAITYAGAATVTFARTVTGFTVGDLVLGSGTVAGFSGSGASYVVAVTYDVVVSGLGRTGTVIATIAADQVMVGDAPNSVSTSAANQGTLTVPAASAASAKTCGRGLSLAMLPLLLLAWCRRRAA